MCRRRRRIDRDRCASFLSASAGFEPVGVVVPFQQTNHALIAVTDAKRLDPDFFQGLPEPAPHAVTVTNFVVNATDGSLFGFVGLDSNRAHQEVVWPLASFSDAIAGGLPRPVLATLAPIAWGKVVPYYLRHPDGAITAWSN